MDLRLGVQALLAVACVLMGAGPAVAQTSGPIRLPQPSLDSGVSVEQALRARRSVREFQDAPLTLGEVSQLLWAAQGVTGQGGQRTAPSAGALYPLTIYLAAGRVLGLQPGVYRYDTARHELFRISGRDPRGQVGAAAGQGWIEHAAAILVVSANPARAVAKYGVRGRRYVHIEVGHAAQSVCLQAVALGLGAADVGAFDDAKVKGVMGLTAAEEPMLLLPLGRPRR